MLNSLYLPVYASSQKLMSLESHVLPDVKQQYFDKSIQAMSYKNQWYALPRDISNLVIYINLDLLMNKQIFKYDNDNMVENIAVNLLKLNCRDNCCHKI